MEHEKSSVHQFIMSLQLLQIMFQNLQHRWTTSWLWIVTQCSSPAQRKDEQEGKSVITQRTMLHERFIFHSDISTIHSKTAFLA